MILKEACTPNAICCGPQTTASQAAQLMRHHHVGDLVVVGDAQDKGPALGIVTDRDLVVGVLGRGLDPATTTVDGLMGKPVVIADETEDTVQVIERMRAHGVRRVPVVKHGGEVVGIITLDDLLQLFVADAGAFLDILRKGRINEERTRR